jgi:hypothetical protein
MIKHVVGRFLVAFLLLVVAEVVGAQTLVATDDDFTLALGGVLPIFADGFESGDTSEWSGEFP